MSLQGLRLSLNPGQSENHFSRVRLVANASPWGALGAEVRLHCEGVTQRDFVTATSGFQTQVPLDVHFGLGSSCASHIDWIEVRWSTQDVERFERLPVDQLVILTKGSEPRVQPLKTWKSDSPVSKKTYDLRRPVKLLEGGEGSLASGQKPTIVHFWAPWCKPCLAELPLLKRFSERFKGLVRIVGVSVETQDLASVRATIKKYNMEYPQFLSDPDLMEGFFGADGQSPLPATFVFDASEKLQRMFLKAVEEEDMEDLLELLASQKENANHLMILAEVKAGKGEYEASRLLFEKVLGLEPNHTEALVQYGSVLSFLGRHDQSSQILERVTRASPKNAYAWYRLGWTQKLKGELDAAQASYTRAFQLNRASFRYASALAAMFSQSGKHREANKIYEEIILSLPNHVEAWLNLAKSRAVITHPKTTAAFQRVLKLEPGHPEAERLFLLWKKMPRAQ